MTAEVVLDHGADRDLWLAARRAGIGGSDIGAILGASRWATPWKIWANKTGVRPDDPPTPPMEVGNALEAGVLALAERWLRGRYGGDWWRDDPPALLRSKTHPVAQYSPDGIIHHRDGTWLMEAKVTGRRMSQPDPLWLAQVQWGMGVTGIERAVVCWVSGSTAEYHEEFFDRGVFDTYAAFAEDWWERHVVAGVAPEVPAPADPDPDLVVELPAALVEAVESARAAKKAAEVAEAQAVAEAQRLMGDATTAMCGGVRVGTWKPGVRTDVDRKALAADGLLDKYLITKQTRAFRWNGMAQGESA